MENGYQIRIGPLGHPGTVYTARVQALPDARDAMGKALDVCSNHARESSFTVGTPLAASLKALESKTKKELGR